MIKNKVKAVALKGNNDRHRCRGFIKVPKQNKITARWSTTYFVFSICLISKLRSRVARSKISHCIKQEKVFHSPQVGFFSNMLKH